MIRIRAYADLHMYYNKDEMDRYNNTELLDLKNNLLKDPPDLLVLCGDLCHTTYKSDDIRFINIIKYATELVDICRVKNIQFRIIQGTSSHDGKIVSILKDIFKNEKHVKCFTNVAYENYKNLVIRYLPEPYFDNYANFKKYAFSDKADITFFHGTIDGVIPMVSQKDNVTNLPKAVVMAQKDFLDNTYLFSAGGHIHKHIEVVENKLFYINSLTTHGFMDIDNIKGYMEFTIDENKNYTCTYIKNEKAPRYFDYKIQDIHEKEKNDIKSIIGNILLTLRPNDKLRFTITGDMTIEAISNVQFIRALMKKYDIKIITKYNDVLPQNVKSSEIDYYTDPSVPIEKKIKKLALDDFSCDMSLDEVKKFIY